MGISSPPGKNGRKHFGDDHGSRSPFLFGQPAIGSEIHPAVQDHTQNHDQQVAEYHGIPDAAGTQIGAPVHEQDHGQADDPQADGAHDEGIPGVARAVEGADIVLEQSHEGLGQQHPEHVFLGQLLGQRVIGQQGHNVGTDGGQNQKTHDGNGQTQIAADLYRLAGPVAVTGADVLAHIGGQNVAQRHDGHEENFTQDFQKNGHGFSEL